MRNPANTAIQHLDNMPPFLMNLLKSYREQGDQTTRPLMDQYQKSLSDPSSIISSLGKGYTESPGYQFKKDQAIQAGNNSAAAGGMLGSPQHQFESERTANGLADQDYDSYLAHALGLRTQGMEGLEGFNRRGYEATDSFAKMLQDYFKQKANLSFEGEAAKNQGSGDMWSMLAKLFGTGAGAALGAGIGGTEGAKTGAGIGMDLFRK